MTTAKITELSAQSSESFEEAALTGLADAARSLRNIQSAWVKSQQLTVDDDGQITGYRVDLAVMFVLDDS